MRTKAKINYWEEHGYMLEFEPGKIWSALHHTWIVAVPIKDDILQDVERQLGFGIDDIPHRYYEFYEDIPEEYVVDINGEWIVKQADNGDKWEIHRTSKINRALYDAIGYGDSYYHDGGSVEPDAPNSVLRKKGYL